MVHRQNDPVLNLERVTAIFDTGTQPQKSGKWNWKQIWAKERSYSVDQCEWETEKKRKRRSISIILFAKLFAVSKILGKKKQQHDKQIRKLRAKGL